MAEIKSGITEIMEDNKMKAYIERLIEEYTELKERTKKCGAYVMGLNEKEAVENGGYLLAEQYHAMKVYEMILFRRLVREVAKGNLDEETLKSLDGLGEVEA